MLPQLVASINLATSYLSSLTLAKRLSNSNLALKSAVTTILGKVDIVDDGPVLVLVLALSEFQNKRLSS